VPLLIAAGADVEARSRSGRTALHTMCDDGQLDCARALLAAGADPDARDNSGVALLHRPLEADTLESLLAAGADVNLVDEHGRTPLFMEVMHVVINGVDPSNVEALLRAGADPLIRDHHDQSPLSFACSDVWTGSHFDAHSRRKIAANSNNSAARPVRTLARNGSAAAARLALDADANGRTPLDIARTFLASEFMRLHSQEVVAALLEAPWAQKWP
jgi:ankyrin repeat protein